MPMSPRRAEDQENYYAIQDLPSTEESLSDLFDSDTLQEINTSKQRIGLLFEHWHTRAIEVSNRSANEAVHSPPNLNDKTRFILRGNPGVGKTALLNYIFSTRGISLRKNSVMWIRVDLSETRGAALDLESLLYAKFISIFCRYYLNKPDVPFGTAFLIDLERYLTEKLINSELLKVKKTTSASAAKNYKELLAFLYDKFNVPAREEEPDNKKRDNKFVLKQKEGDKRDVTTFYGRTNLDRILVDELTELTLRFIQETYGYGYIIMFDGLDSVTIDYVRLPIFLEWLSQIRDVTDNLKQPFNAVYLCTMRDYSFLQLFKKYVEEKGDPEFLEFRVAPIDFGDVLTKKCQYATTIFRRQGFPLYEQEAENVVKNALKAVFYVLDLKEEYNATPGMDGIKKCGKFFAKLIGYNSRAGLRVLRDIIRAMFYVFGRETLNIMAQETFSEETANRLVRKSWFLMRVLLFGHIKERVYHNRIRFDDLSGAVDHEEIQSGLITIDNESRALIPNIFNYRELPDDGAGMRIPRNFVKLRIVRYLMSKPDRRCRINDLLAILSAHYGVSASKLRFETREMIHDGLLTAECPVHIGEMHLMCAEIGELNYPIRLTDLGEIILRKVLRRSIYFETICDDTPIQMDFTPSILPLNRNERGLYLKDYLINKTMSLLNFIFYLQKLEEVEGRIIREGAGSDGSPFVNVNEPFLDESTLKGIKENIISYVSQFLRSRKVADDKALDHFRNDWFNKFEVPVHERDASK